MRLLAGDLQYVRYQIPQRSQKVKLPFLHPESGNRWSVWFSDSVCKEFGRNRQAHWRCWETVADERWSHRHSVWRSDEARSDFNDNSVIYSTLTAL